ncbi:MFS transporter [Williamsia soli]|uniref:MFS transporter n=1 Tax=Williamsia soli TaxID=364929 RepID=UPI001A9F1A31|nr:MFS transporter [Williamsia soli]
MTTEARDTQQKSIEKAPALIIILLGLAAFMAVLDGTAVTTLLDRFGESFDAPITSVVWVVSGYLLAAALVLPISGWLLERWGGRRVLTVALVLFVAGSVLTTTAWSVESLIAFRVIQGFGGGLLEPTSLSLAAAVAGKERMGKVMGLLSVVINFAPIAGPLLGGVLSGPSTWYWIFWINIPIGAVILVGALTLLPKQETGAGGNGRPDIRGLLLLSPGFAAVLFSVEQAGSGSVWRIAVPAILGVALLAGYVVHALGADKPVIDLRMIARSRGYAASLGVMAAVGVLMYSQLVMLPELARNEFGRSGAMGGIIVASLGVGLLFGMSVSGAVSDRTGPRPLVTGGALLTAGLFAVVAVVIDSIALPYLMIIYVGIGVTFGAVASPTFSNVYRVVPADAVPQATTSLFITVQLAAAGGATLMGVLLSGSTNWTLNFGILAAVAAVAGLIGVLLGEGNHSGVATRR